MAVLTFISPNFYEVATIGYVRGVRSGDLVLVNGVPAGAIVKLIYVNTKQCPTYIDIQSVMC